MTAKHVRIAAGIVLGCVFVIVCASALGRDALQGETPRAAQYGGYEYYQMTNTAPVSGGGVVLAIAYVTVIILGIAVFKIPPRYRIYVLLGNIAMPIIWFGGIAANNLAPRWNPSEPNYELQWGNTTFTVPENSGIVLAVYIDFDYGDPYWSGFQFSLYKQEAPNDVVYNDHFGVGAWETGPEWNCTFVPLPAGNYILDFVEVPDGDMEVSIQILGVWSDISPGTPIGTWRAPFLIIGICTAILALVGVIKGRKEGKTTKIIPKPAFASTGNVVDVPFSAISSSTVTALPAPVPAAPITSWTCEACGKANDQTAKFCIGCGKARRSG